MKISKVKLLVLSSLVVIVGIIFGAKMILADSGSNMYGYVWSSNIGWIKLNDCDNPGQSTTCNPAASYGVKIMPTAPGTITGFAWSSNIGWITFNDPGCPTSGCTPGAHATWKSDGSATITGWARVCSVYATNCSGALKDNAYLGTWDGYIALDSTTAGGTGGNWGLSVGSDKKIGGYAWGSQVIGWIKSINAVIYNGPMATLTANPSSITSGQKSTLTLTATDIDGPTACKITADTNATVPAITMAASGGGWSGTIQVSPATTTLYTANCTKSGETITAQATVTVTYFTTPGGSGNGGNGGSGGYCAATYPQFAWVTDASECTIVRNGDVNTKENVSGTSQDTQSTYGTVSQGTDNLYYYTGHSAVVGSSSTYTLQCTGGSKPVDITITVPACTKSFTLFPNPTSEDFKLSSDGKKLTATFTISASGQNGFTSPITLSLGSWPSNKPGSMAHTFSTTTLTNSGGNYSTSQLTITADPKDVKDGDVFKYITVNGQSAGLTNNTKVEIDNHIKSSPIFNEF